MLTNLQPKKLDVYLPDEGDGPFSCHLRISWRRMDVWG